jgi:hypothetical protein
MNTVIGDKTIKTRKELSKDWEEGEWECTGMGEYDRPNGLSTAAAFPAAAAGCYGRVEM